MRFHSSGLLPGKSKNITSKGESCGPTAARSAHALPARAGSNVRKSESSLQSLNHGALDAMTSDSAAGGSRNGHGAPSAAKSTWSELASSGGERDTSQRSTKRGKL